MMPIYLLFVSQAIDLVFCILWHATTFFLLGLPSSLLRCILISKPKPAVEANLSSKAHKCCYYEGIVFHARMAPVKHSFRYSKQDVQATAA
jgi:hypothetical protein